MTLDLAPATDALSALIRGVRDEQLAGATPCGSLTVGELLDHIDGLSIAFTAAAAKERRPDGGRARTPDAGRLGAGWRDRIPAQLDALARAWRPAAAWTGSTVIGGGEMPAEVAGAAGANEVLVHGWDLAVATGQRFPGEDPSLTEALETAYAWVQSVVEQNPNGIPGLFAAPLPVPDDAPLTKRLLSLTGRQPD
jgi:uncharacterized protein (TIGR03086 family)